VSAAIFEHKLTIESNNTNRETPVDQYANLCDDFFVNMNLGTEMELPENRETVLHFFEQIQKTYPSMRNFYSRERGDFVLEEDKDNGKYRWCSIQSRRLCSGHLNPESTEDAINQHAMVLDVAPYLLSVSPLDCETLDVLYGFDFNYRGNHNALIAEALGVPPAMDALTENGGGKIIGYEPTLTYAIDEQCRTQFRISIETRSTAYQVRTGEYAEEPLSVYVTARQYGSVGPDCTLVDIMKQLSTICEKMLDDYIIENILGPLARTISLK